MSAARAAKAGKSEKAMAEEDHRYVATPGGSHAPGVTTIIGVADKPALPQAKAKLTAAIGARHAYDPKALALVVAAHRETLEALPPYRTKGITDWSDEGVFYDWLRMAAERQWKAKADLGSRVHDHAYELTMGREVTTLPDEDPYMDAWERWVAERRVEFIPSAIERVVLHPSPADDPSLEYGGRDDGFAILHAGEIQGLVNFDYKTGGKYAAEVTLQLSAYRYGLGFGAYDEAGALSGYDPLPAATASVSVYLHDDGTYEQWTAPVDSSVFAHFLDLRRFLNYRAAMDKAYPYKPMKGTA